MILPVVLTSMGLWVPDSGPETNCIAGLLLSRQSDARTRFWFRGLSGGPKISHFYRNTNSFSELLTIGRSPGNLEEGSCWQNFSTGTESQPPRCRPTGLSNTTGKVTERILLHPILLYPCDENCYSYQSGLLHCTPCVKTWCVQWTDRSNLLVSVCPHIHSSLTLQKFLCMDFTYSATV